MKRILLVEDDLFTVRLMTTFFEKKGFVIYKATDLGGALNAVSSYPLDAIILDINLPSGSSINTVDDIRTIYQGPIIFYTSDTKNSTELEALSKGGDDLVHKDRGLPILLARLTKVISKSDLDKTDETTDGFSEIIDVFTHQFIWKNREYQLSTSESKLIYFFFHNQNKLCSRDELSMIVNGFPYDGVGRGLDIMISRTRSKLKKITNDKIKIESVRGKGYKFSILK
ncbi:response regulator transcription factor [Vibrio chagasii]|uniref:response regulator transcription factor n=1 Tax=Vibrio chagasii TaxID=170679 RepID=UPI003734EDCB